jgi:hypothetical protein
MLACLLFAMVSSTETAIELETFEESVAADSVVWIVYFKSSATDSLDTLWTEFSSSLGKFNTGSVDASDPKGKAVAKQYAVKEVPSFQIFKGGAKPQTLFAGDAKEVKVVRKMLKKAVKGLKKNGDGKFATDQNCDANEVKGVGSTAKYLLYDVGVGERFNMRRNILNARIMDLMDNLMKIDPSWTLVLPPFRQFNTAVWERWDSMFGE